MPMATLADDVSVLKKGNTTVILRAVADKFLKLCLKRLNYGVNNLYLILCTTTANVSNE